MPNRPIFATKPKSMFGDYPQPSIEIWSLRIDEPMTTLTDLFIAAISIFAWFRIGRMSRQHEGETAPWLKEALRYFRYYFLLMALATTYGGVIGHAFIYAFGFAWKLPGWFLSMLSINLLERAMIAYSKPYMSTRWHRWFSWFNLLELVAFAFLAYYFLNFKFVEIHTAYGLVVFVLAFSVFNYRKRMGSDRMPALHLIIGVGNAVIAGLVYIYRLGVHEWFNHVDISHLFLCIASWQFYLACKKMITGSRQTSGIEEVKVNTP